MLAEIKEVFDKINKDRYGIGYDLSEDYVQISYCRVDGDTPETLSTVTGEDCYNIPLVLCRRRSSGKWVIGAEAELAASEGDGRLVTGLLDAVRNEELVSVETEEYQAKDLLALFIKRSLGFLFETIPSEKIAEIVIAVRNADSEMIRILRETIGVLKGNSEKISFISYEESFFFYMLYQPSELQNHQVLVCDAGGDYLRTYRLERNSFLSPCVATVEGICHKDFPLKGYFGGKGEKDEAFLDIAQKLCENRIFSGVYLIGEGFYEDWCKESLRFLCKNRRVFKGNNLFSKGAAFAAKEKANPSGYEKNIRYLGNEQLKANISIQTHNPGKNGKLLLAQAGAHWYEVSGVKEVILQETDTLPIVVEYVSKNGTAVADFKLEGFPAGSGRMTRVSVEVTMSGENKVVFKVTDLGFGEIFPATGKVWTEEMNL